MLKAEKEQAASGTWTICLVNNMGMIEAETFFSTVRRGKFNYTKWQREYFDKISTEQLHENAVSYAKLHPYEGLAEIVK